MKKRHILFLAFSLFSALTTTLQATESVPEKQKSLTNLIKIKMHGQKTGDLLISHARIKLPPEGAKVASAYLVIKNKGDKPDKLLSAFSSIADHIEIHKMSVENGKMKMEHVPGGMEIPAHGKLVLKSGGNHIMLLGLNKVLSKNFSSSITLTFEHAPKIDINFKVVPFKNNHNLESKNKK